MSLSLRPKDKPDSSQPHPSTFRASYTSTGSKVGLERRWLFTAFLVVCVLLQALSLPFFYTSVEAAPLTPEKQPNFSVNAPLAADLANSSPFNKLPWKTSAGPVLSNNYGKHKTALASLKADVGATPAPVTSFGKSNSAQSSTPISQDRNRSLPNLYSNTGSAQPKGVRPYATYFANYTQDNGTATATTCSQATNTTCSFRNALDAAAADGHTLSNPDVIYVVPTSNVNSGSFITIANTPAVVPDNVSIFADSKPCTAGITDTNNQFALFNSSNLPAAVVINNNDYVEGIWVANGNGILLQGSGSTLTCSLTFNNTGDGIAVTGDHNALGGVYGNGGNNTAQEIGSINNSGNGVIITGTNASFNTLTNANVGNINVGFFAGPNLNGVTVANGAQNNLIGSAGVTLTNIISNNNRNRSTSTGVVLDGATTTNNKVFNNYIGTDANGTSAVANSVGVSIQNNANNNLIGGSGTGQGNLISGNTNGLTVNGGNNNTIQNNFIGTNVAGTAPLGNSNFGVEIAAGSVNTIANNVISGNGGDGIAIDAALDIADSNIVQGNKIGTSVSGNAPLGNALHGIFIGTNNNFVNTNNVISANGYSGILISNEGPTSNNTIQGNKVGISADGSTLLSNGTSSGTSGAVCQPSGSLALSPATLSEDCSGIFLSGGADTNNISNNIVGAYSSPNLSQSGILLDDVSGNTIQNNFVGLNPAGSLKYGGVFGIFLLDGASGNTINQNEIGGVTYGVVVTDQVFGGKSGIAVNGNTVENNLIGVDSNGTATQPIGLGIFLIGDYQSVTGNIIGVVGQGNLIGNATSTKSAGISFLTGGTGTVSGNQIKGNIVGKVSNGGTANYTGIALAGATNNTIMSNTIANNTADGIDLMGVTTNQNTISQNSIYGNGNLGINLNYTSPQPNGQVNGPNNQVAPPVISSVTYNPNSNTTSVVGTAGANAIVEVFVADNSTNPQGQTYIGSTTADAAGNYTFNANYNPVTGANIVATATLPSSSSYAGSTSQFTTPAVAVVRLAGLTVSPTQLVFNGTNLVNPGSQSLQLTVVNATVNYTTTITYGSGASNWLAIAPNSGSVAPGQASVTVTATSVGLTPSVTPYTATITFYDNTNPSDPPQVVNVSLNVNSGPVLTVSPSSLNFTATQGQALNPPSQPVTLTAQFGNLNYSTTITYSSNITGWLSVTPGSGSVSATNGPTVVNTQVNVSGLASGTYTATIAFNNGSNSSDQPKLVNVVLTINPSNSTPAQIAVAGGNGQSTPILTTFAIPLSAIVRDANGNPLAGIVVNFMAPSAGASGTFTGGVLTATATTNANGIATAPAFTANGTAGSYVVLATTPGVASVATFNLVNTAPNIQSGYSYYLPFLANNYQPNGVSGGSFTTYLTFQNSNSVSTTISLRYYDSNGGVVTIAGGTCSTIPAHGECVAPNPFATGQRGEAILTSLQPLNVIVAESTPFGGSAYTVGAGASNKLVAPVAIRGGLADFTTQLTLFNGGSTSVTGTIQFFDQSGNHITAADKTFNVDAQRTLNFDQSTDTTLGNNFYGWAQISSPSGSQLVAQTLEQRPTERFVALVNAQITPQTTLYAPAIFNQAFGKFVTGANIVNPNAVPVTVTINYYRNDGTTSQAAPFTIPAFGVAGIYQGATGGNGIPTGGLPTGSNGWYGSAQVNVSGANGVVMFVNEQGGTTASGTDQSGTYGAATSGATTVGLPVIANGAFGGYITGATIENTTNSLVSGTIQYYDLNGTAVGTPKTFNIGPRASFPVYQGDAAQGLSSGFYGTAVVTVTTGPTSSLLVSANAQSDVFFYSYTEPIQ